MNWIVNTQLLGYTINDAKAALEAGNYTDASKNALTAFVNEAEIKRICYSRRSKWIYW